METKMRLHATLRDSKDAGRCNFCDRYESELKATKSTKVFVVQGSSISVRLCKWCIRDLVGQALHIGLRE